MTPDEQLVRHAQKGDLTALEKLLRRYEQSIYAFLVRMLADPFAAEDAAQEVLVTVMKQIPRYQERGTFKAWIFTLSHRQGLKALRKRRRGIARFMRPIPGDLPETGGPSHETPDQRAMAKEEWRVTEEALRHLPEAEREVVHLHVVEGLTFREIADVTGTPLNTTLGRMRNARTRLKKSLTAGERT